MDDGAPGPEGPFEDDQERGHPTLVPVDDEGTFLVFGKLPESLQMDVQPVKYVNENRGRELSDTLATVAGIGNVAAQGWSAYAGAAGLVRLAPETLAALQAGATPISSGGWALGTLSKGGRFFAQVRWAPAGAAGVTAALATLGPALALLAVQWQLSSVSKAVKENIKLTKTVLDELRAESWHELDAMARVVLDEVCIAEEIGEVSELSWQYLQSQSSLPILKKHRQRNLDALKTKLDDLSSEAKPSEWYRRHYGDVISHSQAVMTAQQAISMHQLMRFAHARKSSDPSGEALAGIVLRETRREHESVAASIDTALRSLHGALGLWIEVDPGKRLSVADRKEVSLVELQKVVGTLHQRAMAGPFRQLTPIKDSRPAKADVCVGVSDSDRPKIERRLWWILADDEPVHLLTRGIYEFGGADRRYLLVVTDRRAFLLDSKDLEHGRATLQELPLEAELTRTFKDGHELVEVRHRGRTGLLKTRTDQSTVYDALTALRARRAAGAPAEVAG